MGRTFSYSLPKANRLRKPRTDSPACGQATAVATVHRTVAKSRLSNPPSKIPIPNQKHQPLRLVFWFGGGWWIRTTEGIASRFTVCPLWPLGKSPILSCCLNGAGRRTRTPDLLITNQLLYQLSYTGGSNRTRLL